MVTNAKVSEWRKNWKFNHNKIIDNQPEYHTFVEVDNKFTGPIKSNPVVTKNVNIDRYFSEDVGDTAKIFNDTTVVSQTGEKK